MRTFTKSILFFALFFIQNNLFSQTSSLFVQDPRQGFRRGAGQIDSAAITVKPKGLYAEVGLYLTYSSKNTNLIGAKDTLEIQHYFALPKGVLVSDSWLWFQDIIIRAKLIDRWTASTIYNQIVGLRQDPSILFKNSPTSYEYRIYPMAGNQTRRVKLTFLIPMRWENNKTYIDLPVNMLLNGGLDPQLNVRIFENPNWKNPSLAQFSDFKFNNQTDSLGATLGGIINVNTLRSTGNLSIVYDSPVKNGIYVSRQPVTDNEGLYQMLVFPNQVVNFNTPGRNVLVAIDHNAGNTNIQTATLFNNLKENLQALLTSKDSFNLIFSRLNPQPLSQNWFSATQLDSVFKTLSSASISNISNLPTLLGNSLEYMNKKGGGRLVLLSSDASFANFNSSNELITELKKIRNPLPQMHILDYSNLNNFGFNVGGAWYYGNGYLYTNLSRQSGGKFLDVLNNNSFTDYTKQIMQGANGSYDNLELYTTLEDGYCHSRFAINEGANTYNSPILQVGRYRGKMPFRVELSGSYDGNDFAKKMTISETDMALSDNTLTSYWAGQNILKLENSNQNDNNTIQQIIENSMNNRILSRYTAFLALEPSQGGDTCRTCDKNNTATTPTKDITDSKFKLTASPNPFKSETVINISFEAWKNNSKAKLVIYDLTGKIVKTFDLDIKQGDTELSFRWEAYDLPAGIYMVKFTSGAIQKTIKLVKM